MYPILTQIDLKKLYDLGYANNEDGNSISTSTPGENFIDTKGWKHSLNFLERYSNDSLEVIDFGCGPNSPFLSKASRLGHSVRGVEYDYDVCRIAAKNMGVEVHHFSEFFSAKDTYDLIFLGDVLEHLSPPRETLLLIKSRLKPGGKLLLQGPLEGGFSIINIGLALTSRFFQGPTPQPPYHVSLATKKSMVALLEQLELKIDSFYVYHNFWPAPRPRELLSSFTFRGAGLFILQFLDSMLSKLVKDYGNRFFLVASIQ